MKMFFKKICFGFIPLLLFLEIFCRVLVDPLYFNYVNIFGIKPTSYKLRDLYNSKEPDHVDYLFIGSSRMNAAINVNILREKGLVAINAGRGNITGGIEYCALSNAIAAHPNFIKDAKVVMELFNGIGDIENFKHLRYDVFEPKSNSETERAMPHLLLPYINFKRLVEFLKYSNNSRSLKVEMIFLYYSSLFRSIPFIREYSGKFLSKYFDKSEKESQLPDEGGIQTDVKNMEWAKQQAILFSDIATKRQSKENPLAIAELDNSMVAQICKLVKQSGGIPILFNMPLHSVQQKIGETTLSKTNKETFKNWASQNGIAIVDVNKFKFTDTDFPDYWHLSLNRRDEFTSLLYEQIEEISYRDAINIPRLSKKLIPILQIGYFFI